TANSREGPGRRRRCAPDRPARSVPLWARPTDIPDRSPCRRTRCAGRRRNRRRGPGGPANRGREAPCRKPIAPGTISRLLLYGLAGGYVAPLLFAAAAISLWRAFRVVATGAPPTITCLIALSIAASTSDQ